MAIKQKEKSEVEFLRATNRKLNAEVRELKRELSRQNKKSRNIEDLETMLQEEPFEEAGVELDIASRCIACNKGTIETIDLGVRSMRRCNNNKCNWRETKKV